MDNALTAGQLVTWLVSLSGAVVALGIVAIKSFVSHNERITRVEAQRCAIIDSLTNLKEDIHEIKQDVKELKRS